MSIFVNVPGVGRIYQRGKVWYLDYWANGVRIRTRSGGNKRAALEELGTKTTDVKRGNLGFLDKKQVVFFSDYSDEYLKIKASGPRPVRSIRTVRGHIAHLKDFFKGKSLSQITPELVEEYTEKRASDNVKIKKKQVSKKKDREEAPTRRVKGTTINRELATLRNLFNIARNRKAFQGTNPVSDITFFPERHRKHKILDPDEYNRLLEAAEPRLRPIIQVAVRTGLRKNDILNLKMKDVDNERGVLTAWISKAQEWQTFQIGRDMAESLKAVPGSGEFLFTNPKTQKAWVNIDKWWRAAKKEAGLDQPGLLIFHDLRANAGTRVEEKAGAFAAQALLGHKNRRTTEIYLNLTSERALAAAQALNDFFNMAESKKPGTRVTQSPTEKGSNVSLSTH